MSNRNTQRGARNVVSGNDHVAVQVAAQHGRDTSDDDTASRTAGSGTAPKTEHIRLGNATVGVQADEIYGDVTIRM